MAEKIVTNPVSLSARDIEHLLNAVGVYGGSLQRRINNERSAEIRKLLERQMDELEEARVALKR